MLAEKKYIDLDKGVPFNSLIENICIYIAILSICIYLPTYHLFIYIDKQIT